MQVESKNQMDNEPNKDLIKFSSNAKAKTKLLLTDGKSKPNRQSFVFTKGVTINDSSTNKDIEENLKSIHEDDPPIDQDLFVKNISDLSEDKNLPNRILFTDLRRMARGKNERGLNKDESSLHTHRPHIYSDDEECLVMETNIEHLLRPKIKLYPDFDDFKKVNPTLAKLYELNKIPFEVDCAVSLSAEGSKYNDFGNAQYPIQNYELLSIVKPLKGGDRVKIDRPFYEAIQNFFMDSVLAVVELIKHIINERKNNEKTLSQFKNLETYLSSYLDHSRAENSTALTDGFGMLNELPDDDYETLRVGFFFTFPTNAFTKGQILQLAEQFKVCIQEENDRNEIVYYKEIEIPLDYFE